MLLHGRDHPELGSVTVFHLDPGLATAVSAGAREKPRAPLDPNEDATALAHREAARLLVVADAHHGSEAAEIAVEHVLRLFEQGGFSASPTDEELTLVLFDAGVAVQRAVSRPGARCPASRTTLAFALVAADAVRWASLGDSCVVTASEQEGRRLDTPREVYLGYSFSRAEMHALATYGVEPLRPDEVVVLATDGFVDFSSPNGDSPESAVARQLEPNLRAGDVARRLVEAALELGAADAVSVAVAVGER